MCLPIDTLFKKWIPVFVSPMKGFGGGGGNERGATLRTLAIIGVAPLGLFFGVAFCRDYI
jgi:hypothetical protein